MAWYRINLFYGRGHSLRTRAQVGVLFGVGNEQGMADVVACLALPEDPPLVPLASSVTMYKSESQL